MAPDAVASALRALLQMPVIPGYHSRCWRHYRNKTKSIPLGRLGQGAWGADILVWDGGVSKRLYSIDSKQVDKCKIQHQAG